MSEIERQILVLDGGFSTQLNCNVEDKVDGTPLWTASFLATNPDAVIKTHLDFLRAGADVIITATYQASVGGFITYLKLSEEESYKLIKHAVHLAKEAVSLFMKEEEDANKDVRKILIAGSVGPYGASLHDGSEYNGNYVENVSEQEMKDWHRTRIQALVEAGVDLLALETIPAQKEGETLVQLLKEFPEQKAWLSFSCKDEHHTSHGEKFEDVALKCWEMNPSQLVAVGTNCVNPKFVTSLIRNINADRSENPIPLVVYPNRGEIYDAKKGWVEQEECRPLESFVSEWLNLGVTSVGGCCRTYAVDILKIKSEVKKWLLGKKLV
ncbi:homocysteine S-methyltransferase-like [Periplaneta americana]|uniref:homocysteine S-methyltransferase-like n=1 Tax=Periplaneta americana TaxID=6978 RepID=UPI0037E98E20